jgi:heat-inducible transcriptional repressor
MSSGSRDSAPTPPLGAPLGARNRKILFAAVTEFIATGEPVGSRTLARKYGLELSAASIRNVLSDLEEAGLLHQPHTSAGRIPSDRALRLFIDALGTVRSLEPDERSSLLARFDEATAEAVDPLREAGRLLSHLSGAAAVVSPPTADARAVSQLRFLRTRPNQLLAVLVFKDGSVENRFLTVPEAPGESELQRIHNLLADVIEGRSLGEARELFARRLDGDRTALDALRRRAFELAGRATEPSAERRRGDVLVIEGQTKLLSLPEYAADTPRLRKLFVALEEREVLLELLDRTIAAGGVSVFVGSEAGELGEGGLSVVVAPYSEAGRVVGTVGVIGPTRMDYAKMLPLVDATAAALGGALDRRRGA